MTGTPAWLRNPHAQMHLCVVLWGFTAILGRLISLDAVALVFWRVLVVSASLALLPRVWREARALPRRDLLVTLAGGLIVTAHWLAFFGAVKLANASVAATCIALAPVFLALIEPPLARRPFAARELLLALAAIPGVVLVVGGIPTGMLGGFFAGSLAALLVALFGMLNKRLTTRMSALTLTGLQLGTGAAALALLIPWWPLAGGTFAVPAGVDILWLALLAYACTLLPFSLALIALRKLSAFSAQFAVNLEPVYTIALAALIFAEGRELDAMFYAGVALILGAVMLHARGGRAPGESPISSGS